MRHRYTTELWQLEHTLAALPAGERSVVLFRFAPGCDAGEDPVYNTDSARPEDSRILRCHDLGDTRDPELFNYLAAHNQADRIAYRYDRGSRYLIRLGAIRDLANRS